MQKLSQCQRKKGTDAEMLCRKCADADEFAEITGSGSLLVIRFKSYIVTQLLNRIIL